MKARVDAARNGGKSDPAALEKQGLTVERLEDTAADLPPSLVAALEEIRPGQSLPVQGEGEQWGYVILLEKEEAHPKRALEVFACAQEALRRELLPALYDAWLDEAVKNSRIRISPHLLPRNVPRPAPRPLPEPEHGNDDENALMGGQDECCPGRNLFHHLLRPT